MAKKNFKSGLGSLIQDTRIEDTPETSKEEAVEVETTNSESSETQGDASLLLRIYQLETELSYWRVGKLNQTKFKESLKKNKLEYNKDTNTIGAL